MVFPPPGSPEVTTIVARTASFVERSSVTPIDAMCAAIIGHAIAYSAPVIGREKSRMTRVFGGAAVLECVDYAIVQYAAKTSAARATESDPSSTSTPRPKTPSTFAFRRTSSRKVASANPPPAALSAVTIGCAAHRASELGSSVTRVPCCGVARKLSGENIVMPIAGGITSSPP